MIVSSFGRYYTQTAHDHETAPEEGWVSTHHDRGQFLANGGGFWP
jgi:hypothetical protein